MNRAFDIDYFMIILCYSLQYIRLDEGTDLELVTNLLHSGMGFKDWPLLLICVAGGVFDESKQPDGNRVIKEFSTVSLFYWYYYLFT